MRTGLEVHRNARSLSVLRRSKSVKRMSWLTFMSAIPRTMEKRYAAASAKDRRQPCVKGYMHSKKKRFGGWSSEVPAVMHCTPNEFLKRRPMRTAISRGSRLDLLHAEMSKFLVLIISLPSPHLWTCQRSRYYLLWQRRVECPPRTGIYDYVKANKEPHLKIFL